MGLVFACVGAQERPAGALGRPETSVSPHDDAVEFVEGDPGPEEALGVGEAAEAVVGGGDHGLGIALFTRPGLGGLLDGEEAGPVEVEQGGELLAQEGVGRCSSQTTARKPAPKCSLSAWKALMPKGKEVMSTSRRGMRTWRPPLVDLI